VVIVDPLDPTRRKHFAEDLASEELLVPILRDGEPVAELPSLEKIRARAQAQLARLSPGIKRFANPHQYPAGLELGLHEVKTDLVLRARGEN
jgi:nicotinate phosphoribosyltransferase